MIPISQKSSAAVLSLQNDKLQLMCSGRFHYNGYMRCALFGDIVHHNTTEKTVHHHYFITASKMPELHNSCKKIANNYVRNYKLQNL